MLGGLPVSEQNTEGSTSSKGKVRFCLFAELDELVVSPLGMNIHMTKID